MLEQIHPSQVLSLRPLAYSQVWMNEAPWLQMGNCSTGSLIGASQSCLQPGTSLHPSALTGLENLQKLKKIKALRELSIPASFIDVNPQKENFGRLRDCRRLTWKNWCICNTPIHSWKCQDSVTSDVALSQQSLHGASQHPSYFLVHPHSFVPFCARLSSIAW